MPPNLRRLTLRETAWLLEQGYPCRRDKLVYKWILQESYTTTVKGETVVVEKGFICDGCSGGGWDNWGKEDWLVHDWLYATGGYPIFDWCYANSEERLRGIRLTRADADSVFGWKWLHRWAAVRLVGWMAWHNGVQGRVRRDLLPIDGVIPDIGPDATFSTECTSSGDEAVSSEEHFSVQFEDDVYSNQDYPQIYNE